MRSLFITGIGTGIGKTLVSAIVAEALGAYYWKPVQAGYEDGTDSERVAQMIGSPLSRIFPETYKLQMAASPHWAARQEGTEVDLEKIRLQFQSHYGQAHGRPIVIEGAGGLLSPLNDRQFGLDLAKMLNTRVVLVSRNYLGSINHSLLTAKVCAESEIDIAGWIFNDRYGKYEEDIVRWSGIPKIAAIPFRDKPDRQFVSEQAALNATALENLLR
jgi:dethiobiotin synthetase